MSIRTLNTLPLRSQSTNTTFPAAIEQLFRDLPGWTDDLNAVGSVAGLSQVGESASELTIGSGTHVLTASTGRGWFAGLGLIFADRDNPATKQMLVVVDEYDSDTGDFEGTTPEGQTIGTGTSTDWVIGPAPSSSTVGKQSLSWAAQGMKPRDTNGATFGKLETATYGINLPYLEFSATVPQYAQFGMRLPKSAGTTTFTFEPVWMHGSAAVANNGVVWQMRALGLGNGDAADAALGSFVKLTDNGGTANTFYFGTESGPFTAANLAALDWVVFEIARLATDGADDLAQPARLIGVVVHMTTTAGTDA